MSERKSRYTAARRLLRDLNQERALRMNPLLAPYADDSYDRLRARVLQAVESLDPGLVVTRSSDRRNRRYQILLRCDLNGESHEAVAAALGISRSRFYAARQEAFLLVADALERGPAKPRLAAHVSDVLSMQVEYINLLREQGKFEAAFRESLRLAPDIRGKALEIDTWTIAADAARCLGNMRNSQQAVDEMCRIGATSAHHERRHAIALRIAACEIGLLSMQGKFNDALARFERVLAESVNERTMYGEEATLFVVLLNFGAEICIERGDWQRAESLILRCERIIDRSEIPFANAGLQRLRARIAQDVKGDSQRASTELRDSVRLLRHHKNISHLAMAQVEYGIALAGIDRSEAMKHIEYGLIMAKEVCGHDRHAMLFAKAAPFLLKHSGADKTLGEIDELRTRAPLSTRAGLLLDIAAADAQLARREFDAAHETGLNAAHALETASLFSAAAKARLIAILALARAGKIAKTNQLLKNSSEFIRAYADYGTRERALHAQSSLGLFRDFHT